MRNAFGSVGIGHLLYDELAAEDDCRFIDIVVFIAARFLISHCPPTGSNTAFICWRCFATSQDITSATHLNVPTPPASRISEVSFNGLPVQRMANARRMCPCATTKTSPFSWSMFSKQGRWYFSLISVIRASRRRTTSSGDLEATQK